MPEGCFICAICGTSFPALDEAIAHGFICYSLSLQIPQATTPPAPPVTLPANWTLEPDENEEWEE